MKKILYFTLSLVLILAACNNEHHESKMPNQQTPETTDLNGQWYKRYTGTVDGRSVVVNLLHGKASVDKDGEETEGFYMPELSGNYYFKNKGEVVSIGKTGRRHDSLILSETADKEPSAKWIVVIGSNTLKGTWVSGDGSRNAVINLKENYADGGYALDVINRDDSVAVEWGKDNALFNVSMTVLAPSLTMTEPEAAFLNKTLVHILSGDTMGATDMRNFPFAINQSYIHSYKLHIQELEREEEYSGFNNNVIRMFTDCVYNDNDLLVFKFYSYGYEGGAHGNYATSTTCVDMRGKRTWEIKDIVLPDPAITNMLDKAAKDYLHSLSPNDTDNKLLVDHVPPADNFTISNTGITFCYSPYEIAGFVYGPIDLYFPYTQIKSVLTPEFKKRMKL